MKPTLLGKPKLITFAEALYNPDTWPSSVPRIAWVDHIFLCRLIPFCDSCIQILSEIITGILIVVSFSINQRFSEIRFSTIVSAKSSLIPRHNM